MARAAMRPPRAAQVSHIIPPSSAPSRNGRLRLRLRGWPSTPPFPQHFVVRPRARTAHGVRAPSRGSPQIKNSSATCHPDGKQNADSLTGTPGDWAARHLSSSSARVGSDCRRCHQKRAADGPIRLIQLKSQSFNVSATLGGLSPGVSRRGPTATPLASAIAVALGRIGDAGAAQRRNEQQRHCGKRFSTADERHRHPCQRQSTCNS